MIFLLAGIGLASWAPLVPYAKQRLGVDDAQLGLILLFLGLGSIIAMPMAGTLAGRHGCRKVIVTAALIVAATLPCLALSDSFAVLAVALAVFGASIGSVDVAMNIQGANVERDMDLNLMSGFHGLFTLGSIIGAGGMSLALYAGASALLATFAISAILVALLALAAPQLSVEAGGDKAPMVVMPRGQIVVIGFLCFVMFLAEGVVLDWGALFLIRTHNVAVAQAGIGYSVFAIAMTIGRLTGDATVSRLGGTPTLVIGSLLAAGGFALTVIAPSEWLVLAGFAAVGLGAANIVPVLFSAAARNGDMPANLAISAAATLGYAGILVGPAVIGPLASQVGLSGAILMVAVLVCLVGLLGPNAANERGGFSK
ncbi:MFS transporter [Devosia aurantiaca]|nr:MFS transporter [Devosia aurantiaca]